MRERIGYLVPEFPGQTHLFFWRELQALEDLGLAIDLFSTRRPPRALMVHEWAQRAEKRTVYLIPFTLDDALGVASVLLKAGPLRLMKCLRIAWAVKELTFAQRVRLAALILPAAKIAGLAKQADISHLHVGSCADTANIALFASILSGLRYSLSLLGPTLEGYGPNQEAKWEHAAFVLIMSDLLYRVATERLRGHVPSIVEVVPVGVDLDIMKRPEPYVPWRPDGPCRIYSCGRLNAVKGHTHLIDAVVKLRQMGIPAELEIAGEDETGGKGYRLTVERHIAERQAGNFVQLLGAVSEQRHKACLETAHVFALASLNEGISVALMEAMAMRTPIVATAVGGNGELIETGVNGILVQPADADVFADALANVLRNPDLALALSERSRRKVEEKFDSRNLAAAFLRCLRASQVPVQANV